MMKRLVTRRVKLFPGREGQSLLLVAILIPVLIIFAAFVVDGAHAFVDYRHLQNAADASSLAAAQDINSQSCWPSSPIPPGPQLHCIQDMVTDYAYQNGEWPNDSSGGVGHEIPNCGATGVQPPNGPGGGDVEACFEWPYNGDNTKVLVLIHDCTGTFLGKFIGVNKICSSVRSVSISNPQVTTSVVTNPDIPPSTLYNTVTSTNVINGTTSVFTSTTPIVLPGSTSVFTNTNTTVVPGTTTPGTTIFNTVVSTTIGTGSDAIFAADTTCDGKHGAVIGVGGGTGNSAKIVGNVYSMGAISINGNPQTHVTKAITDSSAASCKNFTAGQVDSSSSPVPPSLLPWPQNFDGPSICSSAPAAQKSAGPIVILAGSHASGIWCSDTSITVQGNGSDSMTVTLIAPQIHVPAQNVSFAPATQGLLFYLTCGNPGVPACVVDSNQPGSSCSLSGSGWPTVTFCFSPNNQTLSGDIFVPHGTIAYGGNSGPSGLWEAQDVLIMGNSFTLTGTGGTSTSVSTTTIPTTTIGGTTIPTTITSLSTGTVTGPNQTSNSVSTGTNITPPQTSVGTTTNSITIPGTAGNTTTTIQTTGTNLALNQ
jgi:hypothetical protein